MYATFLCLRTCNILPAKHLEYLAFKLSHKDDSLIVPNPATENWREGMGEISSRDPCLD